MSGYHRMYYEYYLPGVYDYPVTHSAERTPSAYNLNPMEGWRYPVPEHNAATYVAAPYGGLINYMSDMQSHVALPNSHTQATGMIFTTLETVQEEEEVTPYPLQSMSLQNLSHMQLTNDEGYEFEVAPNGFCLALSPREDEDLESESQRQSTVVISEVPEPKAKQAKVNPKRKRSHKRVYKSKQGYLVEEPSSELSEEEGNAAEELPNIPKI